MRATWIVLVCLALAPSVVFTVLDWTGGTECLRYIATTAWRPGDPSVGHLALMAISLVAWIGSKVLLPTFLLASVPFALGDLRSVLRSRGEPDATPATQDSDAPTKRRT